VKSFPPTPPVAAISDGLLSGHLWLLELIDGRPLRFQLQDAGLLRVGDGETVYDDPERIPLPFQQAVAHIRAALDHNALRAAVDDVEAVTFLGVATTHESVPYNVDTMPPFLGIDVWAADRKAFRPPDAAAGIFRQLGLTPVNTFERESHARDFTPDTYEIPTSAWYDGPAAGVVIRNKQGQRGKLSNPAATASPTTDEPTQAKPATSIDTLVDTHTTSAHIESIAASMRSDGEPVTVDTVTDRLCRTVGRRHPNAFLGADGFDQPTFRSAVAEQVHRFLHS